MRLYLLFGLLASVLLGCGGGVQTASQGEDLSPFLAVWTRTNPVYDRTSGLLLAVYEDGRVIQRSEAERNASYVTYSDHAIRYRLENELDPAALRAVTEDATPRTWERWAPTHSSTDTVCLALGSSSRCFSIYSAPNFEVIGREPWAACRNVPEEESNDCYFQSGLFASVPEALAAPYSWLSSRRPPADAVRWRPDSVRLYLHPVEGRGACREWPEVVPLDPSEFEPTDGPAAMIDVSYAEAEALRPLTRGGQRLCFSSEPDAWVVGWASVVLPRSAREVDWPL